MHQRPYCVPENDTEIRYSHRPQGTHVLREGVIRAVIETGTNHGSTTGQGKMRSAREAGGGCTEGAPFLLV